MELMVDTTEQGKIKLELRDGNQVVAKSLKATAKISESLLMEIEKLLKKGEINFSRITKIMVNPGPGGFSSTRTGVATANALAYALGIPVAEWPSGKIEKFIEPKYDKVPNITEPRKLSS